MPPLVSVVIPAFNEESFISATISSVLEQDYSDLEIIVCDNASSDRTGDIALTYALEHSNVKYLRQCENIGAPANLLSGIKNASGDYFLLCGAHDLISEGYITELVECIKANPAASLAMGRTRWLDTAGNEMGRHSSFLQTAGLSELGTYLSLMFQNQHYLHGLISRKLYLGCLHINPPITPGSGELVLQELAAKGPFIVSTNAIWYRRIPRDVETSSVRLKRYRNALCQSRRYKLLFSIFPMMQYLILYLLLPFRLFKGIVSISIFLCSVPVLILKLPYCLFADFKFGLSEAKSLIVKCRRPF
jgi:glycosyltransferase involved in cell wall biosynthesis